MDELNDDVTYMEAGTRGGEVNDSRAGPVCKLQETCMHTHREHIDIFVTRLTGMKKKKDDSLVGEHFFELQYKGWIWWFSML